MTLPPHWLWLPTRAIAALCGISSFVFVSGCVDPPPTPLRFDPRSEPKATPVSLSPDQFQDVSEVLSGSEGRVSLAIVDTSSRVVFDHAGSERFELASVAKIYILAAYLDLLAQTGEGPNPEELEQMRRMIQISDNDSATALFHAVGGADGINAFLTSHALTPIDPAPDGSWGSVRASSVQVAVFLARLYGGEVLDVSLTSLSFALLGNVIEEQSWGVGALGDESAVDEVYLKNGWLPGDEGWIVNSVGLLKSTDRTYVVVFMSDRQPDFEAAVHGIEAVVALIRAPLFGPSPTPASRPPVLTPVPTPDPATATPETPSATPPAVPRERMRTPVPATPPALRTSVR